MKKWQKKNRHSWNSLIGLRAYRGLAKLFADNEFLGRLAEGYRAGMVCLLYRQEYKFILGIPYPIIYGFDDNPVLFHLHLAEGR